MKFSENNVEYEVLKLSNVFNLSSKKTPFKFDCDVITNKVFGDGIIDGIDHNEFEW